MADNTCMWPGSSGKAYKYWHYPLGHSLKAEPGNYILAKLSAQNQWEPIYIGEADSLGTRCCANHEKMGQSAPTWGNTHSRPS